MNSSSKAKTGGVVVFVIAVVLGFPNPISMLFLGMVFLCVYMAIWYLIDWAGETLRSKSTLPPLPLARREDPAGQEREEG